MFILFYGRIRYMNIEKEIEEMKVSLFKEIWLKYIYKK